MDRNPVPPRVKVAPTPKATKKATPRKTLLPSPFNDEREMAEAMTRAKAKKTLLPSPFNNEREMAQAMARAKAKKKATPTPSPKPKSTLGPLPKNPTLNDYLIRGLKPPIQGRKKLPSDADVRLRGYNA